MSCSESFAEEYEEKDNAAAKFEHAVKHVASQWPMDDSPQSCNVVCIAALSEAQPMQNVRSRRVTGGHRLGDVAVVRSVRDVL